MDCLWYCHLRASNPLTDYMSASTKEATYICYNYNLYYLVYPDGTYTGCTGNDQEACSQSYFTTPPGLDTLSSSTYEGQTTSASPSVSDCQTLMKDIQGTDGEGLPESTNSAQLLSTAPANLASRMMVLPAMSLTTRAARTL